MLHTCAALQFMIRMCFVYLQDEFDHDSTVKQLQLDCDNHATQITQLNDIVSDQKSQIENLSMQLKEKDGWLSSPKYNSSIASFECAEVSSPENDSAKASMLEDLDLLPPSNKVILKYTNVHK